MKLLVLKCLSSILYHEGFSPKYDSTKAVEIVIYQFEYTYNGNEIADNKIKKLVKWNEQSIIHHLIQVLKISHQEPAKFLPNYIVEITQEGQISFSILTNRKYFKCGGTTYKSMVNIDKYICSLMLKYK
jgi:hypothetical protein